MEKLIPADWRCALAPELAKPYFKALDKEVTTRFTSQTVYPTREVIFKAFTLCPLVETKVVILGQDPYHGADQAQGLSFSVPEGMKIPPSLRNIYKELESDLGITARPSGDLTPWAKQGVLLLNATLTVEAGQPGSHQGLGWEIFTDEVIKTISQENESVVFLLWGKFAAAKRFLIDESRHLVLVAPHPSPFSAYTGFFGSKPFSQTNDYLKQQHKTAINW
jgi:uracil-DNA glycosylase